MIKAITEHHLNYKTQAYASHWELDGVGTDAQKLTSGIVNAQPLPNPNTSTETVLKNRLMSVNINSTRWRYVGTNVMRTNDTASSYGEVNEELDLTLQDMN